MNTQYEPSLFWGILYWGLFGQSSSGGAMHSPFSDAGQFLFAPLGFTLT